MRIHTFQHVPFEWMGTIEGWARKRGHEISATKFHEPFELPDERKIDLLVVMGGPMSIHDEVEHPWLAAEKRFLYNHVHAGNKAVGICLGAQLLADVLGARVYKNTQKEIGWFPVELTSAGKQSGFFLPEAKSKLTTFHWHSDTFDLPRGAIHLARSEACENQAYVRGRNVLGIQFHIEMSAGEVADVAKNCPEDLSPPGPFIQTAEEMTGLAASHAERCRVQLEHVLDTFVAADR